MTGLIKSEFKQRARDRISSGFWGEFNPSDNTVHASKRIVYDTKHSGYFALNRINCFHCETLFQCGELKKKEIKKSNWIETETGMKLCDEHYYELQELRYEERHS